MKKLELLCLFAFFLIVSMNLVQLQAQSSITFDAGNPTEVFEYANQTGCDQELVVPLQLNSINAFTTITFSYAGTAQQGLDFDVSNITVTFNGTETQEVDLIVIDEEIIEEDESIIIWFDEAGFSDTMTIILKDDDAPVDIYNGGPIVILEETFDVTVLPVDWAVELLDPASVNTWKFDGEGLTSQKAFVSSLGGMNEMYDPDGNSEVRLITSSIDARAKTIVNVSFDWVAGGEKELADTTILKDYGLLEYSLDGSNWIAIDSFVGIQGGTVPAAGTFDQFLPSLAGEIFYLGWRWVNNETAGGEFGMTVGNLTVEAEGTRIETTVGAMAGATILAPSVTDFLSDTDQELIASVESFGNNHLGCSTVKILENSIVQDTQSINCQFRSSKVWQLQVPNTFDTFAITLYFNSDEVNDWQDPENLNVLANTSQEIDDTLSSSLVIANSDITVHDALEQEEGYISYRFLTTGIYQSYALTNYYGENHVHLVTSSEDNGVGSIRQAVNDACDGDTIIFSQDLDDSEIVLTSGEILIEKNIVVTAEGVLNLILNGNNLSRIFNISANTEVEINGLTMKNGYSPVSGGALINNGLLTLRNCTLQSNFEGLIPMAYSNENTVIMEGQVILK